MIRITLIPPTDVALVWWRVKKMVQAALEYSGGRFDIDDIYDDLVTGQQTLWVAFEGMNIIGCTTVRIIQYPKLKALCYENLGGTNVDRWLTLGHETLVRYAADTGCELLECQGRSGWKPFLEKLGYKQFAVKFEHRLKE